MNPAAALRARLLARPDSEHENAILRIVLVGLITLYMWWRVSAAGGPMEAEDRILLAGLVGIFVVALAIFAAICIWPASNVSRRIFGMLVDAGGTTFALFLTGESGVGLVGVYLFLIFGYGFRFGRSYLFVSQALSVVGFASVIIAAPWWRHEPYIGWSLMDSIIILPLYVSTLLKRILDANAKTEQALKECLERDRDNVASMSSQGR